MIVTLALLFFSQTAAAPPALETKEPKAWTDQEIRALMTDSPWAVASTLGPETVAFLASARPVREAEEQLFLRRELRNEVQADEEDYHSYITQNPGKHIVVAVAMAPNGFGNDAKELKQVEKECFIRVGKQKIKAVGHFPPTGADPFLRVLFPRVSLAGMKALSVALYLPGVRKPLRDFEFPVKSLAYRGQLEY